MASKQGAEDPRSHWEGRIPFYYGWVVVGASFVTHFVQVGIQLWALSVFVGPMTSELPHWDRSDIFGAVTVRVLISAAGVPIVSRYMDRRHGAIALSVLASGIGGLALAALSLVEDPWEFLVLLGAVGVIAWVGQMNHRTAGNLPK